MSLLLLIQFSHDFLFWQLQQISNMAIVRTVHYPPLLERPIQFLVTMNCFLGVAKVARLFHPLSPSTFLNLTGEFHERPIQPIKGRVAQDVPSLIGEIPYLVPQVNPCKPQGLPR